MVTDTQTLTPQQARLERLLFRAFEDRLEDSGLFTHLSIPSVIPVGTVIRQEAVAVSWCVKLTNTLVLSGSAEQGILHRFADQEVAPATYWAKNQCFRGEARYDPPLYCRDFTKLEMFAFRETEADGLDAFSVLLDTAADFIDTYLPAVKFRIVNVTGRDPGYHKKKLDIEVWTESRGWVETHSCTYFGTEQSRRFGITGAVHTVSNTGLASPRILMPFLDGTADVDAALAHLALYR